MTGFGSRLREARKAKGQTLDQLGSQIGSSKAYVWQLENKDQASPSGDLLMKLCSVLDQTPSYFLGTGDGASDDLAQKEILFRKFQALGERDKQTILSLIKVLDGDPDKS